MLKEDAKSSAWKQFLLHIHPPKLPKNSMKLTRTYGLGGISALLFVVLALTGLLLRFKYMPTIEQAYYSIVQLQDFELFGRLLRNVHYWAANLLIITAVLHLMRVLLTNSIYYERAKNWRYGLVLLLLLLLFSFTGYLLTWDQLSYWAVTIMLSLVEYIPWLGEHLAQWIKGGEHIGQQTLLSFYSLHTGALPSLFVCLMMIHFYLVRKAKGVSYTLAEGEQPSYVKSYPDLVRIELLAALGTLALLLLLSILFDAPLRDMANPEITPNPSKAPWYFIGLQELLLHFHPLLVLCLPLVALFLLFQLPRWACPEDRVGLWFDGKENQTTWLRCSLLAALWTCLLVFADELIRRSAQLDTAGWYGVLLFAVYLLPLLFLWLRKQKKQSANTPFLLMNFCFIMTSYCTFSLIAYFLRGEGMKLFFMQ